MNATGVEHLQEWYRKVAELGLLWPSLRLTCICLRDTERWICVSGRLELSLEEPNGDKVRPVLELDELAALSGRLPFEALSHIVSGLETSLILSEGAYSPVTLPSAGIQPGRWSAPQLWDLDQCKNRLGIGLSSLICQYTDPTQSEPIPYLTRGVIDQKLKVADRPFDGVDHLARSMGLGPLGPSGAGWFQCVSPIPLRFGKVVQEIREQRLSVVVEASPAVDLAEARVNGFVADGALSLGRLSEWDPIPEKRPPDLSTGLSPLLARYRKAVDVRPYDGSLRLALAYKGRVLEERDQLLSPGNPWLRACQFFDSNFTRSKKLVSTPGKIDANRLELAVARLLAIAGFRVAWFGRAAKERKPDILAYFESDVGRKTIAMVECTEEDPARKVDGMAARGKELAEWLSDPSCRVVPIVVTAAARKDADLNAAFQGGVRLAGADEIEEAWQAIEHGKSADEVLKTLTKIDLMKHPDILGR